MMTVLNGLNLTRVKALGATEKRILLSLLQKEEVIFSELIEGEGRVDYRSNVAKALNMLEDLKFTSAPPRRGRRRRPHKLTERGFWTALALPSAWESPETIRKIAATHSMRLPLILGKLDFFESNELLQAVTSTLKIVVENSYDLEKDSTITRLDAKPFSHRNIATNMWLEPYPEDEAKKIQTLSDIITAKTFGLDLLTKLDGTRTVSLLEYVQRLQKDPEINVFIKNYLLDRMDEDNTTVERRIWWIKFLYQQKDL